MFSCLCFSASCNGTGKCSCPTVARVCIKLGAREQEYATAGVWCLQQRVCCANGCAACCTLLVLLQVVCVLLGFRPLCAYTACVCIGLQKVVSTVLGSAWIPKLSLHVCWMCLCLCPCMDVLGLCTGVAAALVSCGRQLQQLSVGATPTLTKHRGTGLLYGCSMWLRHRVVALGCGIGLGHLGAAHMVAAYGCQQTIMSRGVLPAVADDEDALCSYTRELCYLHLLYADVNPPPCSAYLDHSCNLRWHVLIFLLGCNVGAITHARGFLLHCTWAAVGTCLHVHAYGICYD